MGRRIGVLVISANPPHRTHLQRTNQALAAGLDGVHILPAPCSPDKPTDQQVAFHHKMAMCELLVAGAEDARIQVSDALRDCPPTHLGYTTCGLRAVHGIAAAEKASDVFFIGGTDRAVHLRGMVCLMGVLRFLSSRAPSGLGLSIASTAIGKIQIAPLILPREPGSYSSTNIRAALGQGVPYPIGLSWDITDYIREHGLFGAPPKPDWSQVLRC